MVHMLTHASYLVDDRPLKEQIIHTYDAHYFFSITAVTDR